MSGIKLLTKRGNVGNVYEDHALEWCRCEEIMIGQPPPRQPSGIITVQCQLRVREVPGSIPSQGPRHTKDVIKMVPVVPLFSTEH